MPPVPVITAALGVALNDPAWATALPTRAVPEPSVAPVRRVWLTPLSVSLRVTPSTLVLTRAVGVVPAALTTAS